MKVYIYLLYTDFYSKGNVNLKIYFIKRIHCNLPIVVENLPSVYILNLELLKDLFVFLAFKSMKIIKTKYEQKFMIG